MVAEGISLGHFFGNAAAVGSALGFALFTVALRWQHKEDMLPAVCLGRLHDGSWSPAPCALRASQGLAVSPRDLLLACLLGIGQLGLGMTLFTYGSKAVPAAELALLAMSEVVLGPLWVWLALGETAGLWTLDRRRDPPGGDRRQRRERPEAQAAAPRRRLEGAV